MTMPEKDNDHDLLIELRSDMRAVSRNVQHLIDTVPSRDSVQRAHQRIDATQKYLLGVAAFAAIQAFFILKELLFNK